ncbi:MAG: hypothetical protein NT007_10785 [Candidatus Kapabacteria bacterium]|nr:hypothetical protein [Candidatus Kapabacteria bacterium]
MTEIEVFTQSRIQESPSSATLWDSCIRTNDSLQVGNDIIQSRKTP